MTEDHLSDVSRLLYLGTLAQAIQYVEGEDIASPDELTSGGHGRQPFIVNILTRSLPQPFAEKLRQLLKPTDAGQEDVWKGVAPLSDSLRCTTSCPWTTSPSLVSSFLSQARQHRQPQCSSSEEMQKFEHF